MSKILRSVCASVLCFFCSISWASQEEGNTDQDDVHISAGSPVAPIMIPQHLSTGVKNHMYERIRFDRNLEDFEDKLFATNLDCGKFSFFMPLRSKHFNTPSKFNQDNLGFGGRYYPCALKAHDMYVALTYIGRNSLGEKTLAFGIGKDYSVFRSGNFELSLGYEVNALRYGVPERCNSRHCDRSGIVRGVLPMPTLTMNWKGFFIQAHNLVITKTTTKPIILFSVGMKF